MIEKIDENSKWIMTKEELDIVLHTIDKNVEIWVEFNGEVVPIVDYDYRLENNQIVLKVR